MIYSRAEGNSQGVARLGKGANLTGKGMVSPAESIEIHSSGKARTVLELLAKQWATLLSSRGKQMISNGSLGEQKDPGTGGYRGPSGHMGLAE